MAKRKKIKTRKNNMPEAKSTSADNCKITEEAVKNLFQEITDSESVEREILKKESIEEYNNKDSISENLPQEDSKRDSLIQENVSGEETLKGEQDLHKEPLMKRLMDKVEILGKLIDEESNKLYEVIKRECRSLKDRAYDMYKGINREDKISEESANGNENEDLDRELTVMEMVKKSDFLTDKIEILMWEPIKRIGLKIYRKILSIRRKYFKEMPRRARRTKHKELIVYRTIKRWKQKLREWEDIFAQAIVRHIERMDGHGDHLTDRIVANIKKAIAKFIRFTEWAERNKETLIACFAGIVLVLFVASAGLNQVTAYEYAYHGRTLGIVKDQKDVVKILDIVSDNLSRENDAEIKIDLEDDITFKRVLSLNKDIDDTEQVLKRLTYMKDMSATGYGIYIDGKRATILSSEENANSVLQQILSMYSQGGQNIKYEKVEYVEKIEVRSIDTKLGNLYSIDEAKEKILTGAEGKIIHTVVSGETFSGIATMYGLSIADLKAANLGVDADNLKLGQQIVLNKPVPMLTVRTIEVATVTEAIPYETIYEDNSSMYKNEKKIKSAGRNGEREVTRRIVKNNGIQISAEELSSNVISNPVAEVIYKGTKALPPKKGTGSFMYPVSGAKLSSRFGQRWGRMHYGIDLACSVGTPIKASDGGTVVFSGYSGSYGYVIKVDHGGGYKTVYAHCSKLHVGVGERVYKGQHIANVGNTGRSTGPHLHFEVQYQGVQKNPLNYL